MGRIEELFGVAEGQMLRRAQRLKGFYQFNNLGARGGVTVGAQSIRSLQNARLVQPFADQTALNVTFIAQAAMVEIVNQVTVAAATATGEALIAFAESSKVRMNRRVGLARVHEQIAIEARAATINKFLATVGGGSNHYREGAGRLPGKILQALESPELIRAQRDGILYGNAAVLDRIAVHWRRINFGAGAAGKTRQPQVIPLYIDGHRSGRNIGFRPQPSPAFNLPFGVFLGPDGQPTPFSNNRSVNDPFYPFRQARQLFGLGQQGASGDKAGTLFKKLSKAKRGSPSLFGAARPTKGIRGSHFMDAGLFVIGRRLPDEYARLGREWLDSGVAVVKFPSKSAVI